jgi:putative permease
MTKQIIRIGLAVLTSLLALVVLWQFRVIIAYILISVVLASALRPLLNRLAGKKFIVRIAWIMLYVLFLGAFLVIVFLTGKAAIAEGQDFGAGLSRQNAWTLPFWLDGTTFQQTLVSWLPPPSTVFIAIAGEQGQLLLPTILGFLKAFGGVLAALLIIFFLSIYWSINQIHFERLWLSLLPSGQRKQARGIWRVIEPDLGAYIRGQGYLSLLAGLLLVLGYSLLGSPYPVLLGVVGALACLVPVVGPFLAVIPTILVGLLTSVQLSAFTTIYAIGVLIALQIWVKPRLGNRKWDNPILTIVLLLVLGDAFGIIGLILAPPLSVVCQILWRRLVTHRALIGQASQISDLKDRLKRLRETVEVLEEPPIPLIVSSMEQLSNLIEKAEPILKGNERGDPSVIISPNSSGSGSGT